MQKVTLPFRLLGLLLILVAVGIGWNMSARVEQALLWGHRPLFLYLCAYLGMVLLLYPFSNERESSRPTLGFSFWTNKVANFLQHSSPNQRLILASLSGLLLGFGFPGLLPFPFLLLIAFVPLLMIQWQLIRSEKAYRSVFFAGFHAFMLYNILASYWVTNTAFAPGLVAVLANSALMCIPWMFFYRMARKLPRVAYLSLPAAWLTFEWLHYNWDLNWPWLTLGNGFAQFPVFIQWYEYVGTPGGSLWILSVNILIFFQFFKSDRKRSILGPLIALVFIPILFSVVRYYTYQAPAGEVISVGAIQPNFEPHFEKFTSDYRTQLDTFLPLSTAAVRAAGQLDYLLYPETSFSRIEEDNPLASPVVRRLQQVLAEEAVDYLVTGYDGYYIFKPNDERTPAVRQIPRSSGGYVELEALNGTLQIELSSREVQTYRKGVFVPGAEIFPFRDYLGFVKPLVDQLGGSIEGRGTQTERTPLVGAKANIAPVICYESVFGDYFTDYIKAGAQAIFVMTNDGWWDNTPGHKQHLWFSSLRAIETRRAVVRSANMGACAFIDQRGKVLAQTTYDEMGFLNGTLQLNNEITLYVRLGDFLARIAGLLSMMLLLSAFTQGRMKDK